MIDKYKDMGTIVMGKIESGTIKKGDSLLVMPNKVLFLVLLICLYFIYVVIKANFLLTSYY
jgi:translation elongation factor EF-1alpha